MLNKHFIYSYINITGLPHGQEKSRNQEKSGKTKKNYKSRKMGFFEKVRKIF